MHEALDRSCSVASRVPEPAMLAASATARRTPSPIACRPWRRARGAAAWRPGGRSTRATTRDARLPSSWKLTIARSSRPGSRTSHAILTMARASTVGGTLAQARASAAASAVARNAARSRWPRAVNARRSGDPASSRRFRLSRASRCATLVSHDGVELRPAECAEHPLGEQEPRPPHAGQGRDGELVGCTPGRQREPQELTPTALEGPREPVRAEHVADDGHGARGQHGEAQHGQGQQNGAGPLGRRPRLVHEPRERDSTRRDESGGGREEKESQKARGPGAGVEPREP